MRNDIERVFFTADEIEAKVAALGEQISKDFEGKDPLFVGVLKGCFVFMADLMRHVSIPCSMDFMAVSSYKGGTSSTGAVEIQKDILDSGNTLNYLQSYLMTRKPASITIATLMDKPSRRTAPVYAKYSCFEVPDEFVVGYGLDYDELYRNLPFIGVLKPEIYTK